ncbi:MAG: ABC transporter ATP-binding protein [Peptoanaerobacter stomatis]|uniref:ABC transporter ATP-binding protein n=1 Tax=Peptoanaerobacter stomatis TaxID=796937 RepID=UPI003F9F58E8
MKEILTVKNLTKEYFVKTDKETVKVIKGINLSITEGEKVGYVGLNGAGKSTTIKMLTGLIKPTGGEISVLGFNPFEERKNYVEHIGVIFGQRNQLLWDLKVEDSFIFNRSLYKLSGKTYNDRMDFINEYTDIVPLMKKRVLELSLGQKMKCNIALSLLHSPKILFLDEATIGLDIIVKNEIKKLLNEVNREFNTTMLFTSHDMKDIEDVCERIIILEKGNILHDMALKEFRKLYGGTKNVTILLKEKADFEKIIFLYEKEWKNKFMNFQTDSGENSINFSFNEEKINIFGIMDELKNEEIKPVDFTINSDSLEDIIRGIYK